MTTETTAAPAEATTAPEAAPVETTAPVETAAPAPAEQAPDTKAETPVEAGSAKESIASFAAEHAADNPALSLALGFLGDAGISAEDPAFSSAREGDFTLLKAVLAQKGLAGTDQMLAILEGAVTDSIKAQEEHEKATTEAVQSILGDEHEQILTWARENATDEEKDAVNEMLQAGGLYARAVAFMIKDAWAGADVTKPAKSAVQVSGGASVSSNSPLTASEYAAAVNELAKKVGGDPRGTAEYQALSARRHSGRARGI